MKTKPTLIAHPTLAGTKYPGLVNQSVAKTSTPPVTAHNYLSVKEAAVFLRLSKSYLDKARVAGTGPEFIRLGAKKIVYRLADLEAWMRQNRYQSTSEYREGK
ncbi:helix-turn-helix domain-containing protein [Nordella sp. HKS 07]|uniref:helix-turn-helix transcriptional regulator n=1 Tax=Nordella sp. HKS 07 TaxID=2712222 RepID=UPI0013E1D6E0|nr:helix-turn-helix domain-containing protein [Nordella sp. HKS 07]QIG47575.1 helix-turn-helix domain-containing protein [Nordella sp. HKS 07]